MIKHLLSGILITAISCTCALAQWTKLNGPYGGNVNALAHTTNGKTLALVDNYPFISSNEGVTWTEVSNLNYSYGIMADGTTLYAGDYSQFYRSTDGGTSWEIINETYFQYPSAGFHKLSAGTFVSSGYNGTWISYDAGVNWTEINDNYVVATAISPAGDIYQVSYDYDIDQYVLRRHLYPGDGVSWTDEGFETVLESDISYYSKIAFQGSTAFVSANYTIYKSLSGDPGSWVVTESNVSSSYNGLLTTDVNGTLYYFTSSSAYSTTMASGGAFWSSLTYPSAGYSNGETLCVISTDANKVMTGVRDDGAFITTDGGATWGIRSTGFDSGTGYAIETGSDGTLYARIGGYSANSIWKSTDGGLNWAAKATPTSFHKLFMTGAQTLLGYGYSSTYKSINKAESWVYSGGYYLAMTEAQPGRLYASTYTYQSSNYLSYSSNEGTSWQAVTISGIPANTSTYSTYGYVAALNTNTLFLFLDNDHSTLGFREVYKIELSGTTTGTATLVHTVNEDFDFRNFFVQDGKVYLATNSDVYYSADQGTTWDSFSFESSAVFPITGGICLSSNGSAYVTQDDGKSFSSGALPKSDSYINDIAEDTNGDFFAVGYRSVALKNTAELVVDPGTLPPYIDFDWQPLSGPYGGSNFTLTSNPATGNMLSRNNSGTVYTSANVGSTPWQAVEEDDFCFGCAYDIKYAANGTLYGVTYWDIYKSTDDGASWSYINNSEGIGYKQRIFPFSNGSLAMFRYNDGVLEAYRSDDEGQTFGSLVTTFGSNLSIYTSFVTTNDIAFFTYYSYSSGEYVTYRSTDYGASWEEIFPPVENTEAIISDDFGNLFVRGASEIYVSANNGDDWQDISGNINSVASFLPGYKLWVSPAGDIYVAGYESNTGAQGLFVSTDQGATWSFTGEIDSEYYINNLNDIKWQGSTMVLAFYYGLLTSSDGGVTFQNAIEGITDLSFENLELFGNSKLQAYGNSGVFESTDLDTWSKRNDVNSRKTLKLNDGSLLGYSGDYTIRKTIDNGQTWTTVSTDMPEGYAPNQIVTYNGTLFYALANNKIYSTTDFINWTKLNITGMPSNPNINEIAAFSSGRIYFIHYNNSSDVNELYRVQFSSAVKLNVGQNPQNIQLYNGGLVVYDRSGGLYFSANGTTMTQKGAPGNGSKLILLNDNYWFIPTSNYARLWLSRDQGSTWQNIGMNTDNSSQRFTDVVINPFDGYAYATVTNSPVRKSANVVIVDDETAPLLTGLTPIDQSTGVSERPELSLTFDEPVQPAAGFTIKIIDETFNAVAIMDAESDLLEHEGYTLTYKPSTALAFDADYFVVVDEKIPNDPPTTGETGAFNDIFGNAFAGFQDETVWRFTTRSAPTLTALLPIDGATGTSNSPSLTLTFSEPMQGASGKHLNIYYSSNLSFPALQIDAGTGVQDDNSLTFSLGDGNGLDFNTNYTIKAEPGAFQTMEGGAINVVTGNTDWNITTGAQPSIVTYNPEQNATGVFLAPALSIEFSEQVQVEGGYSLSVFDSFGNLFETVNAEDLEVSGNTISFELTSSFNYATTYYVLADYGLFRANGVVVYVLSGNFDWRFTTESSPSLGFTQPANAATGVELNTTFSMTFSSAIDKEPGKFMYIVDDNLNIIHTISIDTDVTIAGSEATFTIPEGTLDFFTNYYILADVDAFSSGGIPFSVLQSTSDWNFTTRDLPTYSTSPESFTDDVGLNETFTITFSGPVTPIAGKNFYVYDITEVGNEFLHATIDVSTINFSGNTGTVPVPVLGYSRVYAFESDNDAFEVSGVPVDVFSSTGDWRVYTVDQPFVVTKNSGGSPSAIFEVEFSEEISCVSGKYASVYDASNSLVGTINLTGKQTTAGVLSLTPSFKLNYDATYEVRFDANAFVTADNVPFSLLNNEDDWLYTTNQAPTVEVITPTGTGTALQPTLNVTFSQAVNGVTGKFARIYSESPYQEVQTISLTGLTTSTSNILSVVLTAPLAFSTSYEVRFDAGSFQTNEQVPFTVLSLENEWEFTTRNPPTVVSTTPDNSSTGASLTATLDVTFSQSVNGIAGKSAHIFTENPYQEVQTIDLTGLSTNTGNTLSLTLTGPLAYSTAYEVVFDAGSFQTNEQVPFTVLSLENEWEFTTRNPPTVVSTTPTNSGSGVSLNAGLTITMSEAVDFVNGKFARVFLNEAPNTEIATIDLSGLSTGVGNAITLTTNTVLEFNKQYEVRFDEGAFASANNNVPFTRLAGANEWVFTSRVEPSIVSLSPADETEEVSLTPSFSITFDTPVQLNPATSGTVIMYRQPDNDATESLQGVVAGSTITYSWNSGNAGLTSSTEYFVKPVTDENGAFMIDGRAFSKLSGNGDWVITTKDITPPTITFVAPTGFANSGTNKLEVTAEDLGGGSVGNVQLHHRGLASASTVNFTASPMTLNNTSGKYEITVNSFIDDLGLEYYFSASDNRSPANTVSKYETGTTAYKTRIILPTEEGSGPEVPNLSFGGEVADYRIFSVPYTFNGSNSVAVSTVFSELGDPDPEKYRLLTYNKNKASGWAMYDEDFTSIDRGKGYWFNSKDQIELTMEGGTTPPESHANPFMITLNNGWNQVGNPYPFDIDWSDIAATNSDIGDLVKFTGSYTSSNQTLRKFEGGFVFFNGSGSTQVAIPFTAATGSRAKSEQFVSGWKLPIGIEQAGTTNDYTAIGMHPDASAGYDGFDNVNPPRFINYLEARFSHEEHLAKHFAADIVPLGDEFEWEFTVASNLPGNAIFTWDFPEGNEFAWDLYLYDVALARPVNMRTARSYTFNPSESSTFKVYYGKNAAREAMPQIVVLGTAYPNPSQGAVNIPLSLPEEGGNAQQVEVVMIDAVGRTLGKVAAGTFPSGYHELLINGTKYVNGTGLYTYQVTVANDKGKEVLQGKVMIKQ